jgi:hypothetical protein
MNKPQSDTAKLSRGQRALVTVQLRLPRHPGESKWVADHAIGVFQAFYGVPDAVLAVVADEIWKRSTGHFTVDILEAKIPKPRPSPAEIRKMVEAASRATAEFRSLLMRWHERDNAMH